MQSFSEVLAIRPEATPMILVEEISHRVVNEYTQAIATIRLAAAGIADQAARATLIETATKLLRCAEAHRALQAPLKDEQADLGAYLEQLCAAISTANLRERRISLTISTDTLPLCPDRCWRVALIVAELITNAVRHGLRYGPGSVRVDLRLVGQDVICRVSDDGSAEFDAPPSRGRRVASSLAADLGGVIHWVFGRSGSFAELAFPLEAAA